MRMSGACIDSRLINPVRRYLRCVVDVVGIHIWDRDSCENVLSSSLPQQRSGVTPYSLVFIAAMDVPTSQVTLVCDFAKVGGATTTTNVTPTKATFIAFHQSLEAEGPVELVDENAVYVASRGMAWFRTDSPEMLDFMLRYNEKHGYASTIIIRPISQSSPNTSPLRNSQITTPTQRRRGGNGVPTRRNVVDPYTHHPIDALQSSQVVTLNKGKVEIRVASEELVRLVYHAQKTGQSVFRTTVTAHDQEGQAMSIDLASHELWFRCICRGHDGECMSSVCHTL